MADPVTAIAPLGGAGGPRRKARGARVLVIGLGDMAFRMAPALIDSPEVGEVVWAGRHAASGFAEAHLLSACGAARVRFLELNALDEERVTQALLRERPDIIVQCGSLLSPWALSGRTDAVARAVLASGFALQLPAQLPIILTVMRAVRAAAICAPVVNCSYPDVTNAVLARLGIAPTIGVGNVGMIAALVEATLKSRDKMLSRVRVLAHHAHVTSVVTADAARFPEPLRPRVYLGDQGTRADAIAYEGVAIPSDHRLNLLSAAHAVSIVRALLPGHSRILRTCAPGPNGLAGGFPVEIRCGKVALDLPPELEPSEAHAYHAKVAAFDGIREILSDGTVVFTEAAAAHLREAAPELSEPLSPGAACERFAILSRHLGKSK